MMRVRDRYQNDPTFRRLVDYMSVLIEDAKTTPTEIREAAMLAQIIYEETHIHSYLVNNVTPDELDMLDRIRRQQ